MIDLIAELSRSHCIAICAFLVPANLIATLITMILTYLIYPSRIIWRSLIIASSFASLMVLHVISWFMIGVVMIPTYILLSLALVCLLINFGCLRYSLTKPMTS